jgi:hypothetical protein
MPTSYTTGYSNTNVLYDKNISVTLRQLKSSNPKGGIPGANKVMMDMRNPVVISSPLTGPKPDIKFQTGFVQKDGYRDVTMKWAQLQISNACLATIANIYDFNAAEVTVSYGVPRPFLPSALAWNAATMTQETIWAIAPLSRYVMARTFHNAIITTLVTTPNPNGLTTFKMLPGGDSRRTYYGNQVLRSSADVAQMQDAICLEITEADAKGIVTAHDLVQFVKASTGIQIDEDIAPEDHPYYRDYIQVGEFKKSVYAIHVTPTLEGKAYQSKEAVWSFLITELGKWQEGVKSYNKNRRAVYRSVCFMNRGDSLYFFTTHDAPTGYSLNAKTIAAITNVEWDGGVCYVNAPWDLRINPGDIVKIPMRYFRGFFLSSMLTAYVDVAQLDTLPGKLGYYRVVTMEVDFGTHDNTNNMKLLCVRLGQPSSMSDYYEPEGSQFGLTATIETKAVDPRFPEKQTRKAQQTGPTADVTKPAATAETPIKSSVVPPIATEQKEASVKADTRQTQTEAQIEQQVATKKTTLDPIAKVFEKHKDQLSFAYADVQWDTEIRVRSPSAVGERPLGLPEALGEWLGKHMMGDKKRKDGVRSFDWHKPTKQDGNGLPKDQYHPVRCVLEPLAIFKTYHAWKKSGSDKYYAVGTGFYAIPPSTLFCFPASFPWAPRDKGWDKTDFMSSESARTKLKNFFQDLWDAVIQDEADNAGDLIHKYELLFWRLWMDTPEALQVFFDWLDKGPK